MSRWLLMTLLATTAAQAQTTEPSPGATPPPADQPAAAAPEQGQEKPAATPASESAPVLPEPPAAVPLATPGSAALDATTPGDDISLAEWTRSDWNLVHPEVSLLELDGYFRLRGSMLRRLDFGNQSVWLSEQRYPANSGLTGDREAEYTTTNMRLRLMPRINVTEDIRIVTTFDILDNLVLGSTPDSLPPQQGRAPANLLSDSQREPSAVDAITKNLAVKHAWAQVSALNGDLLFQFGRMPNHWGLGMMTNAGLCPDCDYGDIVDRVAISLKAVGHIFTPTFEWVSSGPLYEPFGRSGGQPLDALDGDDVFQYTLQIHKPAPVDLQQRLAAGDTILEYGTWQMLRLQWRDLGAGYYNVPNGDTDDDDEDTVQAWLPSRPIDPSQIDSFEERRDAKPIWTGNVFGKLYSGNFELAVEAAIIAGSFTDSAVRAGAETDILKWGAAGEMKYRLSGDYDGVRLSLMGGAASGDPAPGYGSIGFADSQRGVFGTNAQEDLKLNNFLFSPDYRVDMLMFRRILGTVTDAWYIRPGVSYDFNRKIAGKAAVIYSQAMYSRSTPSCFDSQGARCRVTNDGTAAKPMGLEIDAELSYGTEVDFVSGSFFAALSGALLFPFGAFDNPTIADANDRGGSFAWAIEARGIITF